MDMDCFGEANIGKITSSFPHSKVAQTLMDAVRADRVVIAGQDHGAIVKVTAYWAGPGDFSFSLYRAWREEAWSEASLHDVAMDLHHDAMKAGKALMEACSGIESEGDS